MAPDPSDVARALDRQKERTHVPSPTSLPQLAVPTTDLAGRPWPWPSGRTHKPADVPVALACWSCGRATAPDDAEHPERGQIGWPWRTCRPCLDLKNSDAARLSDLLGEPGTDAEYTEVLRRTEVALPFGAWALASRWEHGSVHRWAHIDEPTRELLRRTLARVREENSRPPGASHNQLPCAGCRCSTAASWDEDVIAVPVSAARPGRPARLPLCADGADSCREVMRRCLSTGPTWHGALAAVAAGLVAIPRGWSDEVHFLPSYLAEGGPYADGGVRWSHLTPTDLEELRAYARESHPDCLPKAERDLVLKERATARRAAAERRAAQKPQAVRLPRAPSEVDPARAGGPR